MNKTSSYIESYYSATANQSLSLPALQGDESADVCVIGGGYMGLSSALHLAERGYDVTLLEAERVSWGASGRNGGQCSIGQRYSQDKLEKEFGDAEARVLWDLSLEAVNTVRDLITRYSIDCDPGRQIDRGGHCRYGGKIRCLCQAAYAHFSRWYITSLARSGCRYDLLLVA